MRPWIVAGLVASLALSGLAAWWPTSDDAAGLLPAARSPGRAAAGPGLGSAAAAAASAPTLTLPTRPADWPEPGVAALAAWQGAPAARPTASASASASASSAAAANQGEPATSPLPVFPYQWIGQLDDGGAPQALLASALRSVGVRQGAVVDGRWRLDRAPGEPWKATHLPTGLVVSVRGAPSAAEP